MEKKYTKGEWTGCHNGECSCGLIMDSEGKVLASINNYKILGKDLRSKDEIKATSKLISAAPDLLEALEELIQSSWAPIRQKQKARSAINKALGII